MKKFAQKLPILCLILLFILPLFQLRIQGANSLNSDGIQLFIINPLLVTGPQNTCNNESCKTLLKLINDSKESIDFAIYGIGGQDAIFNALVEAQKRGVIVRGVVDKNINNKNPYRDTDSLIATLKTVKSDYLSDLKMEEEFKTQYQYSKDILDYPKAKNKKDFHVAGAIMHDKFFVFDKNIVWRGSTNISNTCLGGYNGNKAVLIKSKIIAELFSKEFNQMYEEEKFHQDKTAISDNENIKLADGSTVSVYFLPKNDAVYRGLKPVLESAKDYIYVPTFFLTHKKIIQYLIDAHNRGVDVRVILDAAGGNLNYDRVVFIRNDGVPVKVENWGGKMHMKSVIVDDKYIVVGSMNFTSSAAHNHDENMVVINNQKLTKEFKKSFITLWQSVPDKWLSAVPKSESSDSIGSCTDGVDNDHNGLTDQDDTNCAEFFKNNPQLVKAKIQPAQSNSEDFRVINFKYGTISI
ncbi:MAG: phospholipase D-like domain-containing protein [Candidatus Gastranaerophilaceae bacterium]|jgi:phosphatidylserine/phosphatidylglycerophosphate/cardiolipin synthase-like enzyme